MKFKATKYHLDLLNDYERLSAFFEAIEEYEGKTNLAYDLGCGSGILSYFLSSHFDEVVSVEINDATFDCARQNLKNLDNVEVIRADVLEHDFAQKADMIVCEMMDTALIDEEEVPVLNHAKQFLKENGTIIPKGIINSCELVNMEREYVHWDENVNYEVFSNPTVYSQIDFSQDINPDFEAVLSLEAIRNGTVNGLKITTFTRLNDNIICGPTPMLNPPLLVPFEKQSVKRNEFINVKLKYIMGKGIESIRTEILR